jgi:NADPH-dependent glutamate synthase beta subunit-like oxidoreductase/NAD-dependent dihydropyrimidine dehydrogenase PreA subunit
MARKTNPQAARVEEVCITGTGKVYLPPCQVACPVGEDIQKTNTLIAHLPHDPAAAKPFIIQIGDAIYEKNPLFILCSYVCGLCEKECNYKDQTGALRRKMLKRFLVDEYLPYLKTKPAMAPSNKAKVAVIGGGPGGLFAAYELAKRGYQPTIFERSNHLGGAMRLIPPYRMPRDVFDSVMLAMTRISNTKVEYGYKVGDPGKTFADLERGGFKAVFIATGTPNPRALTFGRDVVANGNLPGVMMGLNLLADVDAKTVKPDLFKGKKCIVIGGGNVAFDVSRSARRLGGEITMLCLENADKKSRDGIPADADEIEGATEEGIKILYSRGVNEILAKDGKFAGVRAPRCVSVFDAPGVFNPKFDVNDAIIVNGDVLLVTIGQGADRVVFQQEGLFNAQGRLDVDPVTLQSNLKKNVFIGGDVRRVGYAAEAMREGTTAAESIDRFLSGKDMKAGRIKEYEKAAIAKRTKYKDQTEIVWRPVPDRLNFEEFEKGYTLEEAINEAKRCLVCGPCLSCKGCVFMGLQEAIPEIEVKKDGCSGCGICVALCAYEAITITKEGPKENVDLVMKIDLDKCKRCGLCVAACPSGAITIKDKFSEEVAAGVK